VLTAVISIFGWSYSTIMPVIARDTFGLGASGLGYLYAATGLGALLATVLISALGNRIPPHVFILGGNTIFSLSLFFFTYTTQLRWALPLLFTAGLGLVSQFAMINTSIQQLVRDELRGRVMSIYILMFLGLTPLGNFQIGWISSHMGPDFAIRAGAILVLLAGMLILFYRKRIGKAYEVYKHSSPAQPAPGNPNANASNS
jgi:predicted MFS family arabinose efflux permease